MIWQQVFRLLASQIFFYTHSAWRE